MRILHKKMPSSTQRRRAEAAEADGEASQTEGEVEEAEAVPPPAATTRNRPRTAVAGRRSRSGRASNGGNGIAASERMRNGDARPLSKAEEEGAEAVPENIPSIVEIK